MSFQGTQHLVHPTPPVVFLPASLPLLHFCLPGPPPHRPPAPTALFQICFGGNDTKINDMYEPCSTVAGMDNNNNSRSSQCFLYARSFTHFSSFNRHLMNVAASVLSSLLFASDLPRPSQKQFSLSRYCVAFFLITFRV